MSPLLIGIVIFIGVTSLVMALASFASQAQASRVEDRLSLLAGSTTTSSSKESLLKSGALLSQPLDNQTGFIETFLKRFGNINRFFEQADVSLTVPRFALISSVLAGAGLAVGLAVNMPAALSVCLPLGLGALPFTYISFRRGRRIKQFGVQLPDALEMLARCLRAGQSLASGFGLVSGEIPAPLGREFGRVFEEQNLGIPLEQSLGDLAERIPNLDLKFFATAVILQRQTGGDLAEILDKIGDLIRERFKIYGQIQALTGEGRLSGVVLLALPPVLFLAVYKLNPEYVMVLFTDPMGKKLLAGAIFLQLLGALVIRKIVNIKV
jgi:tight adherence protein B